MANVFLADMKLLQRDNESADTALSAFEKDMFGTCIVENTQDQVANDAGTDTLRYLFGIFN